LKGDKSRLTTLLESRTKAILTQVNRHVLIYSRTKSVTQNNKGFKGNKVLKTAEGRTKGAWGPHAALKTVVENH